jgi:hypothetical protein
MVAAGPLIHTTRIAATCASYVETSVCCDTQPAAFNPRSCQPRRRQEQLPWMSGRMLSPWPQPVGASGFRARSRPVTAAREAGTLRRRADSVKTQLTNESHTSVTRRYTRGMHCDPLSRCQSADIETNGVVYSSRSGRAPEAPLARSVRRTASLRRSPRSRYRRLACRDHYVIGRCTFERRT